MKTLFQEIVNDEPILFSLLGNTLANFDDDVALLQTLSSLLRPQDCLLLEVATTSALGPSASEEAAEEYRKSPAFRNFAASALLQYTDSPIEDRNIEVVADLEPDRAIRIKTLFRNTQENVMKIRLAGGPKTPPVEFHPGDTIRLYLSRKYVKVGLQNLIRDGRFALTGSMNWPSYDRPRDGFSTKLFLLQLAPPTAVKNRGPDVFLAYASPDIHVAKDLHDFLSKKGHSVYWDEKGLRPSQIWSKAIPEAQSKSLATVVLISENTPEAHYQNEEIAAAIRLMREPGVEHHVIAVYLAEGIKPPYGLETVTRYSLAKHDGLDGVAERISRFLNSPKEP